MLFLSPGSGAPGMQPSQQKNVSKIRLFDPLCRSPWKSLRPIAYLNAVRRRQAWYLHPATQDAPGSGAGNESRLAIRAAEAQVRR